VNTYNTLTRQLQDHCCTYILLTFNIAYIVYLYHFIKVTTKEHKTLDSVHLFSNQMQGNKDEMPI